MLFIKQALLFILLISTISSQDSLELGTLKNVRVTTSQPQQYTKVIYEYNKENYNKLIPMTACLKEIGDNKSYTQSISYGVYVPDDQDIPYQELVYVEVPVDGEGVDGEDYYEYQERFKKGLIINDEYVSSETLNQVRNELETIQCHSDKFQYQNMDVFQSVLDNYCELYNFCSLQISFPKISVNVNYYIVMLEEALNRSVITPIKLNQFFQYSELAQVPFTQPNFSPQSYNGYTPATEQQFIYNTISQKDILFNMDPDYISQFQYEITEGQEQSAFEFSETSEQLLSQILGFYEQKRYINQIRVFNLINSVIKIKIFFNQQQSLLGNNDYKYYIIQPQSIQLGQSFNIPYTTKYTSYKIESNQVESLLQIIKNQDKDQSSTFIYLDFLIQTPKEDFEQNNQEIQFENDEMLYRYTYCNPNFNRKYAYISIFSKFLDENIQYNSLFQTQGINSLQVYEKDQEFEINRVETSLMFKYLVSAGANHVYFFKTQYNSVLNILECGENENDCTFDYESVENKSANLVDIVINTDNYNQYFYIEERQDKKIYYIVQMNTMYNLEFRDKQLVSNQKQKIFDDQGQEAHKVKLILTDKYIFESDIPTYVFILIIQAGGLVIVFLLAIQMYYFKQYRILQKLEVKMEIIGNFLQALKKKLLKKFNNFKEKRKRKNSKNIQDL